MRSLVGVIAALGFLVLAGSAHAGLVAVDEVTGKLIAVDATGARTDTGFTVALGLARGLTYDGDNDVYYAVEPVGANIGRIDAATGAALGGGFVGVNAIQALAYDPGSDILYATRSTSPGALMTIDTTTGAGTIVAPIGPIYGLTFDSATGTLYGTQGNGIYAIDTVTGALSDPFGITGFSSESLEFDPVSGLFYGINVTTGQLIAADPTTGQVAAIGAPGGGTIRGLAYVPDETVETVTAPGAAALFALGLAGLGIARQRSAGRPRP